MDCCGDTTTWQCPSSEAGGSSPLSLGQLGHSGRSPTVQRKAAAFARWQEPDESRGSVRDLRGAQGETPGPTRHERPFSRCPRRVRSTSDSGKIAAAQRTDVEARGEMQQQKVVVGLLLALL